MAVSIVLLVGGRSTEHDASVQSYLNVVKAVLQERSRIRLIAVVYIARTGGARVHTAEPWPESVVQLGSGPVTSTIAAIEFLTEANAFIFSLLHGNEGEDGAWQGVGEVLGWSASFGPVFSSAIGMNKFAQAAIVQRDVPGLRIPETAIILDTDFSGCVSRACERFAGRALVIKPNRLGASIGTSTVEAADYDSIADRAREILDFDTRVLVQEFVRGREISCGVIETPDGPVSLPAIEIVSETGFFGHAEKHTLAARASETPLRDSALNERLAAISVAAFTALELDTMARFDFIVDSEGPVYLETNTLPGLMRGSLFPQMLLETGRGLVDLILTAEARARARLAKSKMFVYSIEF